MNILDKLIAAVNPVAGAKRQAARMALDQIESLRNYEAAGKNRRTSHWKNSRGSADAEIAPTLEILRGTSRNMVRNNPYAFQAIEGLVTNIIGTGIRPNFTSENAQALAVVKKYWKAWAESTECDFSGDSDFYGLQELIGRATFESGECLIVRRKLNSSEGGVLPIRLQVLEPDFIDTMRSTAKLATGNYISQGIEYNSKGKRVAYWLFKEHPGAINSYYKAESERYPVSDVIHVYRKLRPGQERGVPAGVASFMRLNDFDDFEAAELMRIKIASCFVAFKSGGDSTLPGTPDPNAETKEPRTKLAPGIIETLAPGETVTMAEPPTTSGGDMFSRQVLRGVAAGYGVTYEILTGDLTGVNFSSGRMGFIEFNRRGVNLQNNVFIPKCGRVFNWFMEALFLVTGTKTDAVNVDWTAPRREMIDVTKETKAIIDQILGGLTSWDEAVRELGWNADELAAAILKSQERFKKMGITVLSDPSNPRAEIGVKLKAVKPVNNQA